MTARTSVAAGPDTLPLVVRAATLADVPEIVTVHLASFEGFFLSFLGREFLSVLYRSLLEDAEGVVLAGEENGRIAGFVAGTTSQTRSYRRMRARRSLAFAAAAAGALAREPRIAPRLARALWRPIAARPSSAAAVLMSIAVRPGARGKGAGRALVRAFRRALAARGARSFCLTTDRDGNERAHRFYARLGFRRVTDYVTPEGRAMTEYCTGPESQHAGA